jgi:hypothetical protein
MPSNRDVHLVKLHKRAFWVQTFDSPILTESSLIHRGWELIRELEHLKRKVDDRFFVFSLYEPPLPFVPHHYEIAVRARCRRHGDAPDSAEGVIPVGDDAGDDDDDYPLPEEGGGDVEDDECQDDSPDQLSQLLAAS